MLNDLTAERLRELLSYDEGSGFFRWNKRVAPRTPAGASAGTPVTGGYISIGIRGTYYKAHRLAWLYVHGRWPSELIDHIDGDTSNNRIANLREATFSQNQINRGAPSNNKTGFKGIFVDPKTGRFIAYARVEDKSLYVGTFKTAEEASLAYANFVTNRHGEFVHPSVRAFKQASQDAQAGN